MTEQHSIVVVGGTSGIGRALAERHAQRGDNVIITGRDQERTSAIASDIGERVKGLALDLAEPATIAERLSEIDRVDSLVISAIDRDHNVVREYDIVSAQRLVTLKLVGYTEVIHALLPVISTDGSVVLFGGMAKERAYPGSTTVTTVNGGINTMIHSLAVELAPIRFNAIHPGIVGDSPFWAEKMQAIEMVKQRTPGGRLVTMEDVIGAVDFLLANNGVNGVNLTVDRGWMLM